MSFPWHSSRIDDTFPSTAGSTPDLLVPEVTQQTLAPNYASWLTIWAATSLYMSAYSGPNKLFMPRVCEKWRRETCQRALWNVALPLPRPARQPANQLPQTDTQTRPGNGHKYEKRNYGIRNAGMANLVLGDQKRRMETLFSWHIRNRCQKLNGQLNPEPLTSCPVLRAFHNIWRSISSRSVKYAKSNSLCST